MFSMFDISSVSPPKVVIELAKIGVFLSLISKTTYIPTFLKAIINHLLSRVTITAQGNPFISNGTYQLLINFRFNLSVESII